MGAFDRTDFALGRYKNAREAYNELVEEAESILKKSLLKIEEESCSIFKED